MDRPLGSQPRASGKRDGMSIVRCPSEERLEAPVGSSATCLWWLIGGLRKAEARSEAPLELCSEPGAPQPVFEEHRVSAERFATSGIGVRARFGACSANCQSQWEGHIPERAFDTQPSVRTSSRISATGRSTHLRAPSRNAPQSMSKERQILRVPDVSFIVRHAVV